MNPKEACLEALRTFIEESSNENKMELYLVYEDIDDTEKTAVLGEALHAALDRIIGRNDHPDAYLAELKAQFWG